MYRQKGKAVQHQDSLWAKAVYMFRHFKTEYGRSVSVNREQPSFEQGPVVQSLDSAICWINNNPVDNY